MIICSCNVLSDEDVRTAVAGATSDLRGAGEVYRCLGCNARCGRCASSIRRIMHESVALGSVCQCCPDGRHCA